MAKAKQDNQAYLARMKADIESAIDKATEPRKTELKASLQKDLENAELYASNALYSNQMAIERNYNEHPEQYQDQD